MINTYIPYITNKEKKYLNTCLSSNFVSTAGPKILEFEKLFGEKFKFKNSVAVNSGTSALHLALLSLEIGKDDFVIVPTFTFAATANVINYTGAKPWFFDCDRNLILDLNKLDKILQKKTIIKSNQLIDRSSGRIIKAIILVQTLGRNIDFEKFEIFAKKYFLKIIFDSAACHDPKVMDFKKKKNSIFCFSFNGNKTITTGAGGILSTDNKSLANKARIFASVGKKKGSYNYQEIGFNYKMTNLQASLGLSQLSILDKILEKKREIFNFYKFSLLKNKNFDLVYDDKYINWVFAIILKKKKNFKKIKKKFHKANIELNFFWKPLNLQKPYKKFRSEKSQLSKNIWNKIIILPSHPAINKIHQKKICNILNNIK